MADARIGVIGGSGLYQIEGLRVLEERAVSTPFGDPSDAYVIGELEGVRIAFLARHGRGHRLMPTELNFRANVYGFKLLGVERIVSASAVGSLREEYAPTDIVFPDQFIDRTRHRPDTFFGDGVVAHVAFAHPICEPTRAALAESSRKVGTVTHDRGVYVCMEGPQFSTRAESLLYRSWGADVIGMTNLQEAKLAREAEICYGLVALPTDYDCWKPHPASLDQAKLIEEILGNVKAATQNALELIKRAIPQVASLGERPCSCQSALSLAIWSDKAKLPAETKAKLALLIGKYL